MSTRRILAIAVIAIALAVVGCTPPPRPAPAAPTAKAPAAAKAPAPTTTTTVRQPVNRAPRLTSVTPTEFNGLAPLEVTVTATATDPDGDTVSFGWQPTGGSAWRITNTTANSATIVFDEPGSYTVIVTAADRCPGGVYDSMRCGAEALPANVDIDVPSWDPEVLARREAAIAADIVAYHNEERVARGLKPLAVDEALAGDDAAGWLAAYVADPFGVGHDTDWLSGGDRGENLRWASSFHTVKITLDDGAELHSPSAGFWSHFAWMNSAGHRATLLNPRWERIGVVVTCDIATGTFAAIVRFEGGPAVPQPDPDTVEYATPPTDGEGVTCTRG